MNPLSDQVAARVRTLWPVFVGHVAAVLVVWLAKHAGVHLDGLFVLELVGLGLSAAVYLGGQWLESRRGDSWPAVLARAAGRWVLSLGLGTGQPTYPGAAPRS